MKKNNLMLMGMTVFMLTACGSSDDVNAVAAGMTSGSDALSEKDAKCMAKNLKKNMSSEAWDMQVAIANGEKSESDLSMEDAMGLMAPYIAAAVKCGIELK